MGASVRAYGGQALKHLNLWRCHPGMYSGRRAAAKDETATHCVVRVFLAFGSLFHPESPHQFNSRPGRNDRSRQRSGREWGDVSSWGAVPSMSHHRGQLMRYLNDDGVAYAEAPTSTVRIRAWFEQQNAIMEAVDGTPLAGSHSLAP